jgi:integrase
MALSAGVHPKVVQEWLGHANIGITLDVYSHVTQGLHDDPAERVAGQVFGARWQFVSACPPGRYGSDM